MARAVRWKSDVAAQLRPCLGPSVLEVGAGIGSNIPHLLRPPVRQWTALEPDAMQAQQITDPRVQVVVGTRDTIAATDRFNAILCLAVLEHIADDAAGPRHGASPAWWPPDRAGARPSVSCSAQWTQRSATNAAARADTTGLPARPSASPRCGRLLRLAGQSPAAARLAPVTRPGQPLGRRAGAHLTDPRSAARPPLRPQPDGGMAPRPLSSSRRTGDNRVPVGSPFSGKPLSGWRAASVLRWLSCRAAAQFADRGVGLLPPMQCDRVAQAAQLAHPLHRHGLDRKSVV